MRALPDQNLPLDLARQLTPHDVKTIIELGWEGIKNGELLRRATDAFDVLVTMDRNLEFQQPISKQTFGVIVVRAASNRMFHLTPLIPAILDALDGIQPGEICRVGA